jgi:hypothetical protein
MVVHVARKFSAFYVIQNIYYHATTVTEPILSQLQSVPILTTNFLKMQFNYPSIYD